MTEPNLLQLLLLLLLAAFCTHADSTTTTTTTTLEVPSAVEGLRIYHSGSGKTAVDENESIHLHNSTARVLARCCRHGGATGPTDSCLAQHATFVFPSTDGGGGAGAKSLGVNRQRAVSACMQLHRGDRPAFTRCLLDFNGSPASQGGSSEQRGGSGFITHAIRGVPRRASSRALVLVRTPSIANEAGKYSEAVNMDWAHHEASPAFDVIVVQVRAGPGRVSLDLVAGVLSLLLPLNYDQLLYVPHDVALVGAYIPLPRRTLGVSATGGGGGAAAAAAAASSPLKVYVTPEMAGAAAKKPDVLLANALGILLSTPRSNTTTGEEDSTLSDLLLDLRSWAQQSARSSSPEEPSPKNFFREKVEPRLTFVADDRSFTRLAFTAEAQLRQPTQADRTGLVSAFARVYMQMCELSGAAAAAAAVAISAAASTPMPRKCSRMWVIGRQRVECVPHFLFLGAAKAGTTSCFHFLSQHPEIGLPADKEPHFFGSLFSPAHGKASAPLPPTRKSFEDEYLPIFPESARDPAGAVAILDGDAEKPAAAADDTLPWDESAEATAPDIEPSTNDRGITGEASVAYLYAPGALGAIAHFLPAARLIVLLREPCDRALSEYNSKVHGRYVLMYTLHRPGGHRKRNERDGEAVGDGTTTRVPDFSSLVSEARRAMASCVGGPSAVYSIYDDPPGGAADLDFQRDPCFVNSFIAQGGYARPLERWLDHFGKQVLVADYTELARNSDGATSIMQQIADHIGLDVSPYGRFMMSTPGRGGFDTSLVYNAAENRGCGRMNASPRSALDPGAALRRLDAHTLCTMRAFFAPFNHRLDALLLKHGQATMSWDRDADAPWGGLACRDLWGMPMNYSAVLDLDFL